MKKDPLIPAAPVPPMQFPHVGISFLIRIIQPLSHIKKILTIAMLCMAFNNLKGQNTPWSTTGNIGIGTTSPDALLTVGSASTRGTLNVVGSTSGTAIINLVDSRTSGHAYSIYNGLSGQGDFNIFDQNASNYRLTIKPSGNVGIGTTMPVSLFQIDDGCTKANIGDASGAGLNYGTSYLGFNAARSSGNWTMHADGLRNGGGLMYASIYGDLYFAPIASTGTMDQVLSDVSVKSKIALRVEHDGTTYAKKVIVELTGWPDYVFKPTYSLKPLSEVKTYIDLNHHLPEMPSEKEVAEKGVDPGEIVKLQTKKIEELTLYMIELQKQIDQLKKK
jgi:hypothetical protein